MIRYVNMKRLLFSLVLMGTSFSLFSQKYFKKYIDSEAHCDDFNTQVLNINDSIFLVNFVSCDPGIHYSNILQYDIKGNLINSITLNKLVNNVKSAHFDKNKLFFEFHNIIYILLIFINIQYLI